MFCHECGNYAANKAIRTLEERGQIGRTERKGYVCFAESDFQFSGGYCPGIPGKPFVDGDSVTVTWDGTSYTRTAKVFPFSDLAKGFYVGNISPLGGEDTGEPFALLSTYDDDGKNFMEFIAVDAHNFEGNSTHRIGCSVFAETIQPIDQKYLPESSGGMAIFNLSDYDIDMIDILMSGQTVTAHDCTFVVKDRNLVFQ